MIVIIGHITLTAAELCIDKQPSSKPHMSIQDSPTPKAKTDVVQNLQMPYRLLFGTRNQLRPNVDQVIFVFKVLLFFDSAYLSLVTQPKTVAHTTDNTLPTPKPQTHVVQNLPLP